MATATAAVNEEAVELIAGACRERVNEMIDDLLKYVNAGDAPGKITLSIVLAPVAKTPGAYTVEVTPALSVKGMRSDGPATIEHVGRQLQLKIAGLA